MLAMLLAGVSLALATPAAQATPPDTTRFVVLGHIRGEDDGLNPRLGEVLAKVRSLRPAFVVLTGDIIWGDVNSPHADSLEVEREWNATDSALATLGVPVYRVPGNHDINDVTTRNIWWRRYGPRPAAVALNGVRLLLLTSAWIPADSDHRHHIYVGGKDLDSAQIGWLSDQLASGDPGVPTLVFMHHLLWWEPPTGPWWKDVHPLLARAKVPLVFSGDYGPLKFSTVERDGVRYYQSSIEGKAPMEILRNRESSRLLSAQFDNFFEVTVVGREVQVEVRTVDEVSSGMFTPARYRAITQGPTTPRLVRAWRAIRPPKRLAALTVAVLAIFGLGFGLGRRRRSRG